MCLYFSIFIQPSASKFIFVWQFIFVFELIFAFPSLIVFVFAIPSPEIISVFAVRFVF
jgi:hypothetical protein